ESSNPGNPSYPDGLPLMVKGNLMVLLVPPQLGVLLQESYAETPLKKRMNILPLFLLLLFIQTCQAADGVCQPSSCGNIPIIQNPFRLTTDPMNCGNQGYNLSCESNTTVLYISSARYYVQAINYKNLTIRLVDDGVVAKGNCSSLPRNPLSENSFYFLDSYIATRDRKGFLAMSAKEEHLNEVLTLISCKNHSVRSAMFMEMGPCIEGNSSRYAVIGGGMKASSLAKMCRVDMMTMLPKKKGYDKIPFQEIHRQLEYGFELSWHLYECSLKNCLGVNSCYLDGYDNVRCNGNIHQIFMITDYGTPSYSSQVRDICNSCFLSMGYLQPVKQTYHGKETENAKLETT
ncbi:hypothetical protein LINGRAHAP2_LOCUS33412, partial [Linum grandiflorum]